MIHQLIKPFAYLFYLFLFFQIGSGCTSTKTHKPMDDFAPDSIANLLVEVEDGTMIEYFEDGQYEVQNRMGQRIYGLRYTYKKIDGTNAIIEYSDLNSVTLNFINPNFGFYKYNTPPYNSGRFEIISHKQKGPNSFEEALNYVFDMGKRSKKNLSPQSLPLGVYRFFIQTQERPSKKGILFFITINENGQYNFEQRHENPSPPHTSHYRYSKKGAQKAELILDGFDKESFYLTYQNMDAGIFMKRSASSDRIFEGIFLKE
ncbi:MAG: hypothetical protein QGF89_04845 [Candidatus Marinimicrobia bacterium]|jgi:hypothetical protein|nr:hypothetical protein [Candidatus Neomarinimicrobiota bacterium]